jgi:hypothetical protein
MNNNSNSMGFPEVQTDTPPQTPPNMKLPSVAGNLITTSTTPTTGTCYNSNNNNNNNNNSTANNNNLSQSGYASSPDSMNHSQPQTYMANYNMQSGSPQKQQQQSDYGQQMQDGFKPFYKK